MPTEIEWYVGHPKFFIKGQLYEREEVLPKMQEILRLNPLCIALAEEVHSFLGNVLILSTWQEQDESTLVTYGSKYPENIHITLGLNSDRIVESLSHELLHAQLLKQGFPRLDAKVAIPYEDFYFPLLNMVQHELMIFPYQELGLNPLAFLAPKQPVDERIILNHLSRDEVTTIASLIQWYGDMQYQNLAGDATQSAWLEDHWWRVEQRFPGITNKANEVVDWIDRGEYQDPTTFETTFNELVSIMGLPPIDMGKDFWFDVVRGPSGAVRRWR
ncbi:MAG TPA: hypothetical protein VKU00_16650 [Chthonomonadaceae bacterium]|nr:hypothetical protein [Chthonomonadaceae bacterium]